MRITPFEKQLLGVQNMGLPVNAGVSRRAVEGYNDSGCVTTKSEFEC